MKTGKIIFRRTGVLLILFVALLPAAYAEQLRYIKQQQGREEILLWQLTQQNDQWLIEAREEERSFRNVVLENGETVRWEITSDTVQLQAHTEDGKLILRGKSGEQEIDQYKDLNGLPWYQPLSYSLAQFLETDQDKTEFWMLRPDNYSLIKMQAVKKGAGVLQGEQGAIAVERVRVRPAGLLGALWQADYWFAADDRQFLKYESSGAMGLAEITVQLDSLVN